MTFFFSSIVRAQYVGFEKKATFLGATSKFTHVSLWICAIVVVTVFVSALGSLSVFLVTVDS